MSPDDALDDLYGSLRGSVGVNWRDHDGSLSGCHSAMDDWQSAGSVPRTGPQRYKDRGGVERGPSLDRGVHWGRMAVCDASVPGKDAQSRYTLDGQQWQCALHQHHRDNLCRSGLCLRKGQTPWIALLLAGRLPCHCRCVRPHGRRKEGCALSRRRREASWA